jgi:hypothetical protein
MKNRIAGRMLSISPSLTLAISAKAKAMKAAGEPLTDWKKQIGDRYAAKEQPKQQENLHAGNICGNGCKWDENQCAATGWHMGNLLMIYINCFEQI